MLNGRFRKDSEAYIRLQNDRWEGLGALSSLAPCRIMQLPTSQAEGKERRTVPVKI